MVKKSLEQMNYWTEKNKFIPVVCKKESADDLAGLKRADDPGRKLQRNETKRHFPYPLAFFLFS